MLQRLPGGWLAALTPWLGDRAGELIEAADLDEDPSMRGEVDFLDVLAPLLARFEVSTSARELFDDVWLRIEPQPASFALLDRIREAGLGVHLGTNQESRRAAYMRRELGYDDLFDQSFYSCDLGVAKPSPAYFETVVERLGVEPGEVLFLDDSAANVDAARSVGLRAEHWHLDHGLPALEGLLTAHVTLPSPDQR